MFMLNGIVYVLVLTLCNVQGLTNVQTLGPKTYWMDQSTRFQPAAADYCRSLGFTSVQFESLDEIEFLSSRLEPANYWTAGVEMGTPEQYHWVGTCESNPIEVPIADIVPYQGAYLDRFENSLRIQDIHTLTRSLCQEL